jgi:capsular polysaccharide export protein
MRGIVAAVHWLDWGIWQQRKLGDQLGMRMTITGGLRSTPTGSVYIGWGLKRSGQRARHLAKKLGGEYLLLEDGFLRSSGDSQSRSHSLIADDLGIYYDASVPSRLESLIPALLTERQVDRVHRLLESWREGGLSKYNNGRDPSPATLDMPYVLVVDQTAGDAAISAGNADTSSFQRMLEDALADNPACLVVVRMHPEVVNGRKRGHFDLERLRKIPRIRVVADGTHPAMWIARAQAVYAVTSQIGFEALLWGKPVRIYGMPFYAGWGLTQDQIPAPARRVPVTLEQLVHACLVTYPRYFDPHTGERCEVEDLVAWMTLQRRQQARFQPTLLAYGFSRWKQPFVRAFLKGSTTKFVKILPTPSNSENQIVTWGRKYDDELLAKGHEDKVLRIEDGFIRSVGLGADLIRPLSWVIDSDGIYYDATMPSGLEHILSCESFSDELLLRARTLRLRIVDANITKYNLRSHKQWKRPRQSSEVILVVGQVESDASIRYGAAHIRGNVALLKLVRAAKPRAWIVYKPHPDVIAKLRDKGKDEEDAELWCDEVIDDIPFETLLSEVDEVHVLTSLAGFEALLRCVPVVTWGQPFYAGWGLTVDFGLTEPVRARRNRRIMLDELVAAALILYPTYVSRTTGEFCSPERAVEELLEWRTERSTSIMRRFLARLTRKL